MPSSPRPSSAARFAVAAAAWSVALLALIRVPAIEDPVVRWLVYLQRTIALWYGAPPTERVVIDVSCSGADVMALCVAVCLAYPARWRQRLAGALGAAAFMGALNTVRIGTLLAVAERPDVLNLLHGLVWPAVLIAAAGVYSLAWTSAVEGRGQQASPLFAVPVKRGRLRFATAGAGMLILYGVTAPWTMTSAGLAGAGAWTASASGGVLSALGMPASTLGNTLLTSRGAFQITPECLLTPMLPLYVAGVLALPLPASRRTLAILLAAPLFLLLAVVRTLVLALPPAVAASPLMLAHGFYQILAGLGLIVLASAASDLRAVRPWPTRHAAGRVALATAAGAVLIAMLGGHWRDLVSLAGALSMTTSPDPFGAANARDVQGALPMLPGFQLWLLGGMVLVRRPVPAAQRVIVALAMLALSQLLLAAVLSAAEARWGLAPHALAIRAWALALPVAVWWFVIAGPIEPTTIGDRSYSGFWRATGEEFPDLRGARSTELYFRDEVRLLSELLPPLRGCRLLKSDLWDEAKNTRILQWAADQGARVTGIDLSEPIVRQAREAFPGRRLASAVADVRRLPFLDCSFDAVYSMGTVEHFEESETAVRELARVLKLGGRLILGVPNRHDPFLRPALVAILQAAGLYAYGFERSYSRHRLRHMLRRAGLDVEIETGILFLPGWLRMLDLASHTRGWRRLERLTAAAVALFDRLAWRFPALRRHGYLLASSAVRAARRPAGSMLAGDDQARPVR